MEDNGLVNDDRKRCGETQLETHWKRGHTYISLAKYRHSFEPLNCQPFSAKWRQLIHIMWQWTSVVSNHPSDKENDSRISTKLHNS